MSMEGEPRERVAKIETIDGKEILTVIENGIARSFAWDREADLYRPVDVNELINQGD